MPILDPRVSASTTLLRDRFAAAKPFKHLLIDDFFTEHLARELLEQFPKPDESISLNPYGAGGAKATHPDLTTLGSTYRAVHDYLRSSAFLTWLSAVTRIEDLLYDEQNYGGGTHENFEGRDLRPHVDFNYHPVSKLHRRINLIVYLNEDWQPEWGGAIALHSDPRGSNDEVTEYQPSFNRCIIFETSERSWHGFERLVFPEGQKHRSRKSLSIYLYTRERPEEEAHAEHTTFFIPRSLPSRFSANRTLTEKDVDELGELFGQRDRLIELYQREQGRRDTDSAPAARLRIQVAELQAKQSIPVMGYVRQTGNVHGRYADGWSTGELRFSMLAERPIRSLTIRARIPEHLPAGTTLSLHVNGACRAETPVSSGIATLSADLNISVEEIAAIHIAISATMNPKSVGLNEDKRNLGFFLECAMFEHGNETPRMYGLRAARVQPRIYLAIGDCHTARFDGLTFESPEHPQKHIVVKSRWQTYARAQDVFKNGSLNETLTRVFTEMRLIRQTTETMRSPFMPLVMYTQPEIGELMHFLLRPDEKDAVLLFSFGEVDIWDIANKYVRRYRFDVPGLSCLELLPDDEDAPETLSLETVRQVVAQRCAPLFEGLTALRDFGFTNIFLHEIPPPGLRRSRLWNPARLRYKLCTLFNQLYKDFCRKNGIGFISILDEISADGLRDLRYDQDGVHLTPETALISIGRLEEKLLARRRTQNPL
jgi:Rps23 Pro-64 3,4-dihydroxylase Tpa1-like proline 4-hydroxylase